MAKKLIAVFITVSLWLLFTFKLTDVPPGINGDEAAIGLNAVLISQTGKDLRGNFLPLFSSLPDSQDWKQPVTVYATALAFKIFGSSYFTLRAVSVFFSVFSAYLMFLLINQIKGFKLALMGVFIFVTAPIIMIQSHLALENIAPLPLIIFFLILLHKYHIKHKTKYLIWAGVSLGLALFSYLGMRLIVPVLAASTGILRARKNLKTWILLGGVLLPFFILLIASKSQYPGAILGLFRPYGLRSYQDFFLSYISSFDPSFLFIAGDTTPYHSTGKHGMFLLASLPLFILGMIRIIQQKKSFLIFILATFFLIPAFFYFSSTIHRASRLLAIVPFFVIIATVGVEYIFRKKIIFAILTFLMILNYADFLNDYWYHYPQRVKQEFAVPLHKVFESLKKQTIENNLTPLMQHDLPLQNPTAFSFFEKAYFQNNLGQWMKVTPPPKDSITFVDSTGIAAIDAYNFNIEKFPGTDYALVINK